MKVETDEKYIAGNLLQKLDNTITPLIERHDNLRTDNIHIPILENSPSRSLEMKSYSKGYKRRPGLIYKKVMNSKLYDVPSCYFNTRKHQENCKWIPPRSPYALLQEDLFDRPWQLLIATIFLTKTKAQRAVPETLKFLLKWPRPEDLFQAKYEEIHEFLRPLGLGALRSLTIMKFTVDFLTKNWQYPRELYGIGKYGDDSYRMFCINEWKQVTPDDIPLSQYKTWLLENEQQLGLKPENAGTC